MILSEAFRSAQGSNYDTLLVGGGLEPGEVSLEPKVRSRGIRLETVGDMRRSVRPWSDARALARMVRIVGRERPTIVHTHTAKAGAIGRMAAILQRVPVILHTFHGHVFDGYFRDETTRSFIRVERWLARFTDRILVLSERQKHDIVERYRIAPPERVSVVPLGLELDRFRADRERGAFRREIGITDEPLIVAIGRIVPIKRLDRLLEAFRQVNMRLPGAHLVIVGDGEVADRRALESLAQGLNVHFVGYRSDTPRILADADALALTSDNEGTPVAVIEALVSGTPVVATNVGGVREIVPDGGGTIVDREDDAGLSRALHEACLRSARLPSNVRDSVHERYSHRRLIRDIGTLYDELVSARRPRTQPGERLRAEVI